MNKANEKTDFGFKNVDKGEKASMVYDVFKSVASKYDIMNDLMSGGLHRAWKNHMISLMKPKNKAKLLDLAGGTGDIAFRFIKSAKKDGIDVTAVITDINEYMLEEGRSRAVDKNIISGVEWSVVDAQDIPFDDNSFDFCTIAFGIRNVTDIPKALKEIYRVLKPNGKFVCLEFSHIDNEILSIIYDTYSFNIIPKIGEIVAGDRASYQYLVESIRRFPDRETFAEMMKKAGFSLVKHEALSNGVVAIHSGWKIEKKTCHSAT